MSRIVDIMDESKRGLGLTEQEWEAILRDTENLPPLTDAQVSRISLITGLIAVDDP